jgi:hypothetical protein
MGEPDLKTIEAAVKRAKADQRRKAGEPMAAEVVANDDTLRPFSIRMTAKEIVALKGMARLKGVSTSDLVRSMIAQGLAATLHEPVRTIDPQVAAAAMEKIRDVMIWAGAAASLGASPSSAEGGASFGG